MNENKKIKIYVITHKKYDIDENDIYTPLFVGAKGKETFNYLRDDTGDNISEKNQKFSELTGLYWVWKNSDADIIGINHYRRLFVDGFLGTGNLLTKNEIQEALEKNDVIVYKKRKKGKKVYETFRLYVSEEDMKISCDVFERVHPKYNDIFQKIINGKEFYAYSILISSKEWFDDYCNWLFTYLFELEKEIYKTDNFKNKRVLGYIAEILLIVYIYYNNFKAKEYYLNFKEANSNVLANLINTSHTLDYLYYYAYLNEEKI